MCFWNAPVVICYFLRYVPDRIAIIASIPGKRSSYLTWLSERPLGKNRSFTTAVQTSYSYDSNVKMSIFGISIFAHTLKDIIISGIICTLLRLVEPAENILKLGNRYRFFKTITTWSDAVLPIHNSPFSVIPALFRTYIIGYHRSFSDKTRHSIRTKFHKYKRVIASVGKLKWYSASVLRNNNILAHPNSMRQCWWYIFNLRISLNDFELHLVRFVNLMNLIRCWFWNNRWAIQWERQLKKANWRPQHIHEEEDTANFTSSAGNEQLRTSATNRSSSWISARRREQTNHDGTRTPAASSRCICGCKFSCASTDPLLTRPSSYHKYFDHEVRNLFS